MKAVDVVWHFSRKRLKSRVPNMGQRKICAKASKLRLNGTHAKKTARGTQQLIYFRETWPLSGAFCIKGLQCWRASYSLCTYQSCVFRQLRRVELHTNDMCAVSLRHFFSPHLSRAQNSMHTAASQKAAEYIKFLGRC